MKRWMLYVSLLTVPVCEGTHLLGDVSIFVDIVKVESPVELFLDCASQQDRKAHDEILRLVQNTGTDI